MFIFRNNENNSKELNIFQKRNINPKIPKMASFGKINNFDSLYLSDSDDEETKHQKSIDP